MGTTSRSVELGTSTSLEVTSDQYGLMLLEAGTRDIICNPSLTDPSQYPGKCEGNICHTGAVAGHYAPFNVKPQYGKGSDMAGI